MIYHDQSFATLAEAPVKSSNVEVALQTQNSSGYADAGTTWSSSTVLMSVAIDSVGSFLGTATKKASVKLLGIVAGTQAGDVFQIRLGLYNNDPGVLGFNDISQGFYVVDTIAFDYEAGSTTVTMYDLMWKASQTAYQSSDFTYPTTVAGLAQQVANKLGATLNVGFSTLPNASFTIPVDLYASISNATLQTVIQEIAASTGTSARMSDTTLVFTQFTVSGEVLTSHELKTLKIGNLYGPVTSVVLGRVPQNDNIFLANGTPNTSLITDVNTITDKFTVNGHGMSNGTLVQLSSTGTLPAPLLPNTNYYVSNVVSDGFTLTNNYLDAIDTTTRIDLTTAGTGTISLSELPTQEVQINNIQILDNDRQTLLPPLYAALLGLGWNASTADTIGLGWHEVGDVIFYQQGSTVVNSFLTEVHITLAGSVKESLVSVIPNAETINYQTAGGILKTIYDTEIKVDKQNSTIDSIVSQQQVYADQTFQNFSDVYQTIDGVTTTVQSVGGGNMLTNSVGLAKEASGSISSWSTSGSGSVTSYTSAVSLAAGALSGNAIELTGSSIQISQQVKVANTAVYSVGFRVNKALGDGSARLYLTNDVTNFYIDIPIGNRYQWDELKLEGISPAQGFWNVSLVVTSPTTKIEITDLRILLGTTLSQWTQAQGEISSDTVSITKTGIRVSANDGSKDYTSMTPTEFKGYSDANSPGSPQPVFWLNRDTTRSEKISVNTQIDYGTTVDAKGGVIRTVVVKTGSRPGIAFVGAIS